jgi:hypothetical protein
MIARLEALLARVRTRAAEPRRTAPHTSPAAIASTPGSPAGSPSEHPSIVDDDEMGEWPTRPPPPAHPAVASPIVPTAGGVSPVVARPADTEVDVAAVHGRETGQVVVGSPAEEAADTGFESRERLVAAEPLATEEPQVAAFRATAPVDAASAPEVEAVIEEAGIDEAAIEEAVAQEAAAQQAAAEEAPASSRRPVAPQPEERIAQIAFGAEEPRAPLHTPPPESGRLPAAAVADFDADVTGVRDAPPIGPDRSEEEGAQARPAESGPSMTRATTREGVPEVTRAKLPAGDGVAEAIGEAQRFTPSSFVALVDASLAL